MMATHQPVENRKRGRYIGGHEAAAIVGANPYMSPADVYARLALNASRSAPSKAMQRGTIIEPGLISLAEERLGPLVRDVFFLSACTRFGGSLDGLTVDGFEMVEVTTCGKSSRHLWADGPSPLKTVQSQFYMGLSGARVAHVLCLDLVSDDVYRYTLDRDEDMIARIDDAVLGFWERHISPRVPPAPFDGWGSSAHLDLVFPGPREAKDHVDTEATDEIKHTAKLYGNAREVEKKAKQEKETLRDRLHALIGNATRAQWDGGRVTLSPAGDETSEPDWLEVAITLRDKLKVGNQEFARIVDECSHPKAGKSRRIDVRLKGEE